MKDIKMVSNATVNTTVQWQPFEQKGKWNRIESQETASNTHGNLLYGKGGISNQQGKNTL